MSINSNPKQTFEFINMRKLIILTIVLALVIPLSAQQAFHWGVQAGGKNSDVINDITSLDNNIYVTGRFSNDFASGKEKVEAKAMTDIYLIKLNNDGKTLWVRTLTGQGANNATRITAKDNNIFTGGIISESVWNDKKQFPNKGKSIFVSSWDEQGKTNWLTQLSYTGHATLDVLEINPDGTLLAGGLLQGKLTAGGKQLECQNAKRAWSVLLTSEGHPLNAELSSGEGSHRLVSASFDDKSNLYQLFSVSGDFSWISDSIIVFPNSMKSGLVLTKTDYSGKIQWIKTFESTGYSEGIKVLAGKNKELVVCTNFNKELKMQDTILNSASQLETTLSSFNNSGELQWIKSVTSPVKTRALDVLYNRLGNILVSGYFRNSYTINEEQYLSDVQGGNIFLLQFDPKGEMVWHDEPGQDAAGFSKAFTLDQS